MSSFNSLASINLWNATSTQCTFQSPVFIRALMKAASEKDFDAVQSGLDKALQLGIGQRLAAVKALQQQQQQQNRVPPHSAGADSVASNLSQTNINQNTLSVPKQGSSGLSTRQNSMSVLLSSSHAEKTTAASKSILAGRDSPLPETSNINTNESEKKNISSQQQNKLPLVAPPPTPSGRHPPSLSFTNCLNEHPTLALFGDWVNFCNSQEFSTLQSQHCLLLLQGLLHVLSVADPDTPPFNENSVADNNMNNVNPDASSSSLAGSVSASSVVAAGTVNFQTLLSNNNNNNKGEEDSGPSPTFVPPSGPPETVVETLKNFLAKCCSRRTVLVLDHHKSQEAEKLAKSVQEKIDAATAVAQASSKESGSKRGGASSTSKSKSHETKSNPNASLKIANESIANMSFGSGLTGGDASSLNSIASNIHSSLTAEQQQLLILYQQQQQQQTNSSSSSSNLRDLNPFVKEHIMDPVFNVKEVRAICAFAAETVFQHWRLISVLQRAPDGLTVPCQEHLVIETIPVAIPATSEGTGLKSYQDTQSRLKAFDEASNQLEKSYQESIKDRNATIRQEYDHTTSVATRRDKVMREDDLRKQMKPDEFKRTVRVLSHVFAPEILMEQMVKDEMQKQQEEKAAAATEQQQGATSASAAAVDTSDVSSPVLDADQQQVIMTLEKRLERLEAALAPPPKEASASRRHR